MKKNEELNLGSAIFRIRSYRDFAALHSDDLQKGLEVDVIKSLHKTLNTSGEEVQSINPFFPSANSGSRQRDNCSALFVFSPTEREMKKSHFPLEILCPLLAYSLRTLTTLPLQSLIWNAKEFSVALVLDEIERTKDPFDSLLRPNFPFVFRWNRDLENHESPPKICHQEYHLIILRTQDIPN